MSFLWENIKVTFYLQVLFLSSVSLLLRVKAWGHKKSTLQPTLVGWVMKDWPNVTGSIGEKRRAARRSLLFATTTVSLKWDFLDADKVENSNAKLVQPYSGVLTLLGAEEMATISECHSNWCSQFKIAILYLYELWWLTKMSIKAVCHNAHSWSKYPRRTALAL